MKRAALIVLAVAVAGLLSVLATRPAPTSTPTSSGTPAVITTPAAVAPRISRADVDRQHDEVTAPERSRMGRTRLLDATLVTAAQAHGVSITTGDARGSDRDRQDMVITPDPDLTVREIADRVARICAQLADPCERRDYRFLIQTPTGRALLPARLIHAKD